MVKIKKAFITIMEQVDGSRWSNKLCILKKYFRDLKYLIQRMTKD